MLTLEEYLIKNLCELHIKFHMINFSGSLVITTKSKLNTGSVQPSFCRLTFYVGKKLKNVTHSSRFYSCEQFQDLILSGAGVTPTS
jgi:hypothetical protein